MVFLFNIESFWIGFETESIILIVIFVISTQWRYYLDYRRFYNKTNRFEDYYEMHKHFMENKIVNQLNNEALKKITESVSEMRDEFVHMKNDLKNQLYPAKVYELINKIHDRLDNQDKAKNE